MLSALQHWSYCPRQCALIHLDQAFDENVHTMRGNAASCDVHGTLARVEGKTKFTEFMLRIQLKVPSGTDENSANMALQKAKTGCFISNSLAAQVNFEIEIIVLPEM